MPYAYVYFCLDRGPKQQDDWKDKENSLTHIEWLPEITKSKRREN